MQSDRTAMVPPRRTHSPDVPHRRRRPAHHGSGVLGDRRLGAKPTHLLRSLVSQQRELHRQAFQRLFEGPPRAAVQ